MIKDKYDALLISDFNMANFAAYLTNDPEPPSILANIAPFGQVAHTLLDSKLECWEKEIDFAIIWTQPQGVIDLFAKLIQGDTVSIPELLSQVDEFADSLISIQNRVGFAFVSSWALPDYCVPTGLLDLKQETGISNALMHMNLKLAERLDRVSNFHILNAEHWIRAAGKNAYNPKLWYMAKIPFANQVWVEAAKHIKSAVDGVTGKSRKLIIVDLDNTLWGGIVGDLGWEKLNLGGHDPTGEAYLDFQKTIKAIKNKGTLLAIASKNEEGIALEAIDKHPEMVLRRDDFCTWRINWNDKATNIADLVAELNIGLQSAVFLDDNPVERARVRETLPEILVPDLPEDKMLYRSFLVDLRCFDKPAISQEDIDRTRMYLHEKERINSRKKVGSFDQWLETLQTKVIVEELNGGNLSRTVQLLNKTNQMNLSTRRLTETELTNWLKDTNRNLKTFRVRDKFGDSGLTGIISWELQKDNKLKIVDFILSCRVMGRRIEQAMLHAAIANARQQGLKEVYAEYLRTAKNAPCLKFFQSSGMCSNQEGCLFKWDCSKEYPFPNCIIIETK